MATSTEPQRLPDSDGASRRAAALQSLILLNRTLWASLLRLWRPCIGGKFKEGEYTPISSAAAHKLVLAHTNILRTTARRRNCGRCARLRGRRPEELRKEDRRSAASPVVESVLGCSSGTTDVSNLGACARVLRVAQSVLSTPEDGQVVRLRAECSLRRTSLVF